MLREISFLAENRRRPPYHKPDLVHLRVDVGRKIIGGSMSETKKESLAQIRLQKSAALS